MLKMILKVLFSSKSKTNIDNILNLNKEINSNKDNKEYLNI